MKKPIKIGFKNNLEPSEISPKEWLSINQFLQEIKQIDSSCVTIYYPYGKGQETISLLQETKRKESFEKIEFEIEKRIRTLKENPSSAGKFTKTLCIFGWIKDGKVKTKEIGTSKKLPYIYMASKKPYVKPFGDILKINYKVFSISPFCSIARRTCSVICSILNIELSITRLKAGFRRLVCSYILRRCLRFFSTASILAIAACLLSFSRQLTLVMHHSEGASIRTLGSCFITPSRTK